MNIKMLPNGNVVANIPELDLKPRTTNDIVYGQYFGLTAEEYDKYVKWCREIGADKYAGAIGGDTTFHITPTSIGEIITVTCRRVARDINGKPIEKRKSRTGQKRYKMRTYKCVLRDIW